MGFASIYLKERALFPDLIKEAPDEKTGIIVVVPAYNEPGITRLLDSIISCTEPECKVEVIIIVNAPEDASSESKENNELTVNNIESWKTNNKNCFFRLFVFIAKPELLRGWGVGLARKTGMDEAVRRFNFINKPDGIIVNLDADCLVADNYLVAVYNEFMKNGNRSACSIYFEHPLSGNDFPEKIYHYIALYELHLRYYYQALAFCGFPYVFHTVGSSTAVKALNYVKAGGMNRRQAGEDFYFIQKLVPAGGYFSISSTTVFPSPRPSFRVPFGTGAAIEKLKEENSITFHTYNMLAFKELRSLFRMIDDIYNSGKAKLTEYYGLLPSGMKAFINEKEWSAKISEIINNTAGLPAFKKRFFGWFNMFRIVKYLNFVHSGIFEKKPVLISASELLNDSGIILKSMDAVEMLSLYRQMEKED